jgi:opacity protein-like surface antigen
METEAQMSSRLLQSLSLVGALAVAGAATAHAQDRAVVFSARAGGLSALRDLNSAGTQDFKPGFVLGGSVGVQVMRYLAIQVDVAGVQNRLRTNGAETGVLVNRYFYGAAVRAQYPTTIGVTPYVLAGGGAVTFHEKGTSGQDKTRGAGRFGLGLEYQFRGTGLQMFAQADGFVYDLKQLNGSLAGLDRSQVDMVYTGGVSYRLPF